MRINAYFCKRNYIALLQSEFCKTYIILDNNMTEEEKNRLEELRNWKKEQEAKEAQELEELRRLEAEYEQHQRKASHDAAASLSTTHDDANNPNAKASTSTNAPKVESDGKSKKKGNTKSKILDTLGTVLAGIIIVGLVIMVHECKSWVKEQRYQQRTRTNSILNYDRPNRYVKPDININLNHQKNAVQQTSSQNDLSNTTKSTNDGGNSQSIKMVYEKDILSGNFSYYEPGWKIMCVDGVVRTVGVDYPYGSSISMDNNTSTILNTNTYSGERKRRGCPLCAIPGGDGYEGNGHCRTCGGSGKWNLSDGNDVCPNCYTKYETHGDGLCQWCKGTGWSQ